MEQTKGSKKLAMRREGRTWRAFAADLGFATTMVWNWANGVFKPDASRRIALEKLTGGEISVEDWEVTA